MSDGGPELVPGMSIEEALKAHTDHLMSIPGVAGTSIGQQRRKPCIVVFVRKKAPELVGLIPSSIEGYAVIIREAGEFRALGPSRRQE
mgnify:CR=1 FL=1